MNLPTGTVTFLLTDVEGSTRAWQERPTGTGEAMALVERVIAEVVAEHDGILVKARGEGDSAFCVFVSASSGVAAAVEMQRRLLDAPLRVRAALHTGDVDLRDGDYYGLVPSRCARLRSLAAGGQVLCTQATAMIAVDLPPGVTLRDLGSVRLRSFSEPERVGQVTHPDLPAEFPALPTNRSLPPALTSFVGRRHEMKELAGALEQARLVTLTGAGGCGKSRLMVETARLMDEPPGGIWFTDLSPVADPSEVALQAAAALGLRTSTDDALDALLDRLGDDATLVILDNCEHQVAAVAELCEALLRGCPLVTVATTSREPIGSPGEVVLRVPSLSLPVDTALTTLDDDAVQLFVDRARAVLPSFQLTPANQRQVGEICRRLDGIPLAIELAASRVSVLSMDDMVAGLERRFALLTSGGRTALSRQRTLEASVDWSYDLLDDDERTMLRRLSVFVASFSLDGVRGVCSDLGDADAVLHRLTSLVAKSLVLPVDVAGLPRYRLLDTIRHYGQQKLVAAGELSGALDCHLEHYRAFSGGLADAFLTDRQAWCVATAWVELGNFYAAVDHALASGDGVAALETGRGVWGALNALMPATEERQQVRRILDATTDCEAELRHPGLFYSACLAFNAGDLRAFLAIVEELKALRDTLDDPMSLVAIATVEASALAFTSLDDAREVIAVARELSRDAPAIAPGAAYFEGLIEFHFGDLDRAQTVLDETAATCRRLGQTALGALALTVGACTALSRGDLAGARRLAEASLECFDEIGPVGLVPMILRGLAEVALLSGDITTARRWHEEAVAAARLARGRESDVLAMSFAAVRLALWEGRLDEAVAAGAPLVRGRMWDQWFPAATLDLVEAYLAAGETGELPGFAARIREVSESFPHDHHRGGTRLVRARVLLHEGDAAGAVEVALSAIAALGACHARMALPDALRILGLAIVEEGDLPRGVRVVAAGEAMRAAMGAQTPPYAETALALGASHPAEWAEGQAMSWEEAVAYAQRGRGGRKRATSGWDSLTPTEQQVVDLVTQGASNKQVAERLFMSVPTVKSHLTHVFAKLAVSSRSQLTAEAAKRPS